eukprot:g5039.t1
MRMVETMLDNALQLDTGRYSSGAAPAILYAIRLAVRMESFLICLVKRANWEKLPMKERIASAAGISFVRGLEEIKQEFVPEWRASAERIRTRLLRRVFPMLVQWIKRSMREEEYDHASVLRAHLAYVFKNCNGLPGPGKGNRNNLKKAKVSIEHRNEDEDELFAEDFNPEDGDDPFADSPKANNQKNSFPYSTKFDEKEDDFQEDRVEEDMPGDGDMFSESPDQSIAEAMATTLLCSQVFLTATYRFDVEPLVSSFGAESLKRSEDLDSSVSMSLGIPQTEMFSLFQAHRGSLLRWLTHPKHSEATNEIMEEAVRVVTNLSSDGQSASARVFAEALKSRTWRSMTDDFCAGRFLPDTETEVLSKRRSTKGGGSTGDNDVFDGKADDDGLNQNEESYEDFLRAASSSGVDTEINIQLGEFTLKKNRVKPLDGRLRESEAFYEAFGEDVAGGMSGGGLPCAEVRNTSNRAWVRLVGRRHDIKLWEPSYDRFPKCPFADAIVPLVGSILPQSARQYPSGLTKEERWVSDAIRPLLKKFPNNLTIYIQNTKWKPTDAYIRLAAMTTHLSGGHSVKEIVVFNKKPAVVHVYHIIERGRRFYRSIQFSSDSRNTLYPTSGQATFEYSILCKVKAAHSHSLVVERNLSTAIGRQTHVPARELAGLIPAALLEEYVFWQNAEDDSLIGYQKPSIRLSDPSRTRTQLKIELVCDKNSDKDGHGLATASAIVRRYAVKEREEVELDTGNGADSANDLMGIGANEMIDESIPPQTLLSLMYARPNGPLARMAEILQRLDNLSHCMCWTNTAMNTETRRGLPIDLVELPRVKLTFKAISEKDHTGRQTTRLYSTDHENLFVSNEARTSRQVQILLDGIPHAIVLERKGDGALYVLLPATARPCANLLEAVRGFTATELRLDNGYSDWLSNLGNVRHYLYPVHLSRWYMSCPTLASALYLLLLRFLNRQYERVFQLAESCIKDSELTAEEKQIAAQLADVKRDKAPDAVACRLRLCLITSGTPVNEALPFEVDLELDDYLTKLGHVSGTCRLDIEEELLLLQMAPSTTPLVINRKRFLEQAISLDKRSRKLVKSSSPRSLALAKANEKRQEEFGKNVRVEILNMPTPPTYDFDGDVDLTVITAEDGILDKFSVVSYKRPSEECTAGEGAIESMKSWMDKGIRVRGSNNDLGFLFIYELLSGRLPFRMVSGDIAHNWGCVLLRMLPETEHRRKGMLMSILRIMAANPEIAREMPKFEDTRTFKLATMFRGQNVLQSLLKKAKDVITRFHKAGKMMLPPRWAEYDSVRVRSYPPLAKMRRRDRTLIAPRNVRDFSCKERVLQTVKYDGINVTEADIEGFAKIPMRGIGFGSTRRGEEMPKNNNVVDNGGLEQFVSYRTRVQMGKSAVDGVLPFDVSSHPSAAHKVARNILVRLRDDLQLFSKNSNEKAHPELIGWTEEEVEQHMQGVDDGTEERMSKRLETVLNGLLNLRREDERLVARATDSLLKLSNRVDMSAPPANASPEAKAEHKRRLGFLMSRHAGQEPKIWLQLLVSTLLSTTGAREIQRINPFLDDEQVQTTLDLTVALMLTVNRLSQTARCISIAQELLMLLKRPTSEGQALQEALIGQASKLAEQLVCRRFYVKNDGGKFTYDPRLLVFEFIQNILLREPQVQLVEKFKRNVANGSSACHQMLMGAGKTTVVAPLLALILSDGKRLVMQVVPRALLEFSRNATRTAFSGVLRKSVYTFKFDRFTAPRRTFLQKLIKAKAARGVVISDPTSIKAFALKFIECINTSVDLSIEQKDAADKRRQKRLWAFFSRLTRGGGNSEDAMRREALAEVKDQATLCVQILKQIRKGSLILDEVDLILHPLKSELNWPMGRKEPLDFTISKSGNGLRWQIPFYLLDAIFVSGQEEKKLKPVKFDQSREAEDVLNGLREIISLGRKQNVLQSNPHFVLADDHFYHNQMKPLLVRWMYLWLAEKQRGTGKVNAAFAKIRESTLTYLQYGRNSPPEVLGELRRGTSDDQMKMLNLSHDWLLTFLPHVLRKVNRVHFGLLQPNDIKRALETGNALSESRKLTAVPFVGKDVPSRASEFAHPDTVIGLTVLAYRYEGLRKKDFNQVMTDLRSRMDNESGEYNSRKANKTFIKWVSLAGGRVRGTKKVEQDENRNPNIALGAWKQGHRRSDVEIFQDIWPLQLIDLRDGEQMLPLFRLLRYQPNVIEAYLNSFVFPETCRHQGVKLSACGQSLGGSLLFKQRFGFSGTPSDLLPVELGKCNYEKCSDGKMIHFLTNPSVVSHQLLPSTWSSKLVLDFIAAADPPYHALIDTGALVTGMSNFQVARYLLNKGMPLIDAVVFLDQDDRKMVLVRRGMKVLRMSQCGIPKSKRFAFYDQVHTTGMDIKHVLDAEAVLTLSKDMVFRDYAQGAFRMRGIGKGQRVKLYIPPEVGKLMQNCAKITNSPWNGTFENRERESLGDRSLLVAVVAWLVVNSMKSERSQFDLLCQQSLKNVWRKTAYAELLQLYEPKQIGSHSSFSHQVEDESDSLKDTRISQDAVEVFRERIDYTLDNAVPQAMPLTQQLGNLVNKHKRFLSNHEDMEAANRIRSLASGCFDGAGFNANVNSDAKAFFDAEEEQEQEQEQEVEQEQQKEQEQEVENEEDRFASKKYSRDNEHAVSWPTRILGETPSMGEYFFPMSQFAVYQGRRKKPKPLSFPDYMFVSQNVYRKDWQSSLRRLKNVIIVMDWKPLANSSDALERRSRALSTKEESALKEAWELFCSDTASFDLGGEWDELDDWTGEKKEGASQSLDQKVGSNRVLMATDLGKLLSTIGVEIENDAELSAILKSVGKSGSSDFEQLTFDDFTSIVEKRNLLQTDPGRYFVVISLSEAETLRGLLHMNAGKSLLEGADASLSLRAKPFENIIIDQTYKYEKPKAFQEASALQSAKFFDSDAHYQPKEISILLRILSRNSCKEREQFFLDVRTVRRRKQTPLASAPIVKVFTTASEFHLMAYRATISRIREILLSRGLYVADAFKLFDTDVNGLLGCSEIFSGLEALGMFLTPDKIRTLVRRIDNQGTGFITFDEWKKALCNSDLGDDDPLLGGAGTSRMSVEGIVIKSKKIDEIADVDGGDEESGAVSVDAKFIKFKIVAPDAMELVWNSRGSGSRDTAAIWKPISKKGFFSGLSRPRCQLCIGHFANPGTLKPVQSEKSRFVIEATDTGKFGSVSKRMEKALDQLLPMPKFYRLKGSKKGKKPVYIWEPIPANNEYVAIGCIATTTSNPPRLSEVRCVQKSWLVPAEASPIAVWDDAGTSGKPMSLWTINAAGVLAASSSHSKPEDDFYDLISESFTVSKEGVPI